MDTIDVLFLHLRFVNGSFMIAIITVCLSFQMLFFWGLFYHSLPVMINDCGVRCLTDTIICLVFISFLSETVFVRLLHCERLLFFIQGKNWETDGVGAIVYIHTRV